MNYNINQDREKIKAVQLTNNVENLPLTELHLKNHQKMYLSKKEIDGRKEAMRSNVEKISQKTYRQI